MRTKLEVFEQFAKNYATMADGTHDPDLEMAWMMGFEVALELSEQDRRDIIIEINTVPQEELHELQMKKPPAGKLRLVK